MFLRLQIEIWEFPRHHKKISISNRIRILTSRKEFGLQLIPILVFHLAIPSNFHPNLRKNIPFNNNSHNPLHTNLPHTFPLHIHVCYIQRQVKFPVLPDRGDPDKVLNRPISHYNLII